MRKPTYLVLLFSLVCLFGNAQQRLKKAEKHYKNYSFSDAIVAYETLISQGNSNSDVFAKLGNAEYYNANYTAAVSWYEKLFVTGDTIQDPEYLYRYAQSLKSVKDYNTSDIWMAKFQLAKAQDSRVQKWKENLNYLQNIGKNSGKYDVTSVPFNSTSSDFAPTFKDKQLVFSTARDSGIVFKRIHTWNKKPFLNLYQTNTSEDASFTSAHKLKGKINRKTHESSAVFTKDGTTVYFTRNYSKNGRFKRDENGLSHLQVFKATFIRGKWRKIKPLPFNSKDYSVAHPALSFDEKRLYFSSNMEGSLGQSDIFYVDILEDGSYGAPVNMGNRVNTESRESFPFVSASNLLFFASDGHPGLGGLDMFAVALDTIGKGEALNMGRSINSEQDDFSLIIDEEEKTGFFASNRTGGQGSDDIYQFTMHEPLVFTCEDIFKGVVGDGDTGLGLANSLVTLTDAAGKTLSKTITDQDGNFSIDGNCISGSFEITATKEDYETQQLAIAKTTNEDWPEIALQITKQAPVLPVGTDLASMLAIAPISFGFDQSYLDTEAQDRVSKVVRYLEENPLVKIQIRSHTDVRGSATYNQTLSEKRAKATMEYMLERGIDQDRLTYEGLGESELLNSCTEGEPCSRAQHEMNRRAEFVVVN